MILWLEVIQEPLYKVLYLSKSAMAGWIDTSTVCNFNENLLRSYYGLQIMAWTKTHFPLTVKLKWRAHLIYYLWLCQVCVSPTMSDVSETKSTLFFGSRAMKITNTAYINVEVRVMLQRIICVGVLFRLDKWKLLIRSRYVNFTLYENVVAIEREFFVVHT